MLDGIISRLADFYYFFEDKYYEVLDRVNEVVPVYSAIDPIDRIVPSFVLFALLLLLALLLVIGFATGAIPPFWEQNARFVIADPKGSPISGAMLEFSLGDKKESKSSDSLGGLKTGIFGKGVLVSAKRSGYAEFSKKMDVASGKKYSITMQPESKASVKQLEFELREGGKPISASTEVTMEFSCTGGNAPKSFTRNGPSQSVSTLSTCGLLTATINSAGFEEARATVDVLAQSGKIIVSMSKKPLFGSLKVIVKDETTNSGIKGINVVLKREGILVKRADATDSSGTTLLENVPFGTYFAEATAPPTMDYLISRSELFTIEATDFSGGQSKTMTIFMKKPLPSEPTKLLLKFVDSVSKAPIEGVKVELIIDDSQAFDTTSAKDGIAEFSNLSKSSSHAAIATHHDYVTLIVDNLALVLTSETVPKEIALTKAIKRNPNANSGTARVKVSEFAGQAVANADVMLFTGQYSFPIGKGKTGSDGFAEFTNLTVADYNARAIKVVDSVSYEGNSPMKRLEAGAVTEYPIVLVISNGKLSVKAIDDAGRPISDVNVAFIDSVTSGLLAATKTDASGTTRQVEFAANKRPYIVAKKDGYLPSTTLAHGITPNAHQQITVKMWPLPSAPSGFDVKYEGIYESASDRKWPNRVEANKQYYLRLYLMIKEGPWNVKSLVRTGLEREPNAGAGIISIRGFSSLGAPAVFSSCFDAADNYKDCSPVDATSGAKQVVATWGSLNGGAYEFVVPVFIKPAPDGTPIEIRYGAIFSAGGTDSFKPSQRELYLVTYYVNRALCTNDCGFQFQLKVSDEKKELIQTPQEISLVENAGHWEANFQPTLLKGYDYAVDFNIFNDTRDLYTNAPLFLKSTTDAIQVQDKVDIPRLSPGAKTQGSFKFRAAGNANAAKLDMSLNLGKRGDSALVTFKVSGLNQLSLVLSPTELKPNIGNYVNAEVKDFEGKKVENALVAVYEHGKTNQVSSAMTNANGAALLRLESNYAEGTAFDVNASKIGHVTATRMMLVVSSRPIILPGIDCITADDKLPEELSLPITTRGGEATFKLKNSNCGRATTIELSAHGESDITITPALLSLNNNTEQVITVKAGKQFGVHPVFVRARLGTSSEQMNAGTVRAIISNPLSNNEKSQLSEPCIWSSRLGLESGAPSLAGFVLDFEKQLDSIAIVNKCYTGLQDDENSINPVDRRLPRDNISEPPRPLGDSIGVNVVFPDPHSSLKGIKVFRAEQTTDPYYLITAEDYVKGES